jgi:hypothetical protein
MVKTSALPLVLAVLCVAASQPTQAQSLAESRQTLRGPAATTADEAYMIQERITFTQEGDIVTIVRSGKKRTIRLKSEEIWVERAIQTHRVRYSELSPDIAIDKRWPSVFKNHSTTGTNAKGHIYSSVVLSCRDGGSCIEMVEMSTKTCVSGCKGAAETVAPASENRIAAMSVPTEDIAESTRIAKLIIQLIEGSAQSARN